MLKFFLIMILLYLALVLYYTLKDMYKIYSSGELLYNKQKTLEQLVATSGYSDTGWGIYEEYQQFLHEYGDIISMYVFMMNRPVEATVKITLQSFIIVPITIYQFMKDKLKRQA